MAGCKAPTPPPSRTHADADRLIPPPPPNEDGGPEEGPRVVPEDETALRVVLAALAPLDVGARVRVMRTCGVFYSVGGG